MKPIKIFIRALPIVIIVMLLSSQTARAQYYYTCSNTFSTANTGSYTSFVFVPDAGHVIRINGLDAGFNVVAPDVLVIDGIGYPNTNPTPAVINATRPDGFIYASYTDNTSALTPFYPYWTSTISCVCDPYASPPTITYAPNVICTDKTLTAADFTFVGGVVDGYGSPYPLYIYEFQYRYPSSPSWIPGLPAPPLLVQPITLMARLKRNDPAGCVSPWSGDRTIYVTTIPQGSLTGNTICSGGTGQLTYTSTSGASPFSLVISGQTYTGVVSGTPFNANPNPSSTTEYTLTSITSFGGCVRTSDITDASATITVLNQWTGSVSSDWNTSGNWSCGLLPNSLTDVIIPNLPPYPVISSTSQADCRNLEIQTGATLTIESDGTNSGSLIVNGSSSGPVTYNRIMPGNVTSVYWHYVSSPVSPATTPAGTFYAWNEENLDADVNDDWVIPTALISGSGYTLQTNGNSVSFIGSVVQSASITATSPYFTDYGTGDIVNPGSPADYEARWDVGRTDFGGGGWNLLGNPFTSALQIGDPNGFLDVNDGDGTIETNSFDPNYVAVYIYNGTSYFYRGRTTDFPDPFFDETPANQMFGFDNIQAGQGFFVLAMKDDVTFTFDKTMQTHGNSTTMLKSANTEDDPWFGLHLKVKYGNRENITTIVYNEKMTTGLDPGYDIGQMSAGPEVEIYTTLIAKDNSVNFARQALPVTDCEKNLIPVGIDSENGGEVVFSAFVVPPGDYKFFLEDRKTGTFTQLGTNTYTVTLPSNTYGTGRFFILTSANTPTTTGPPPAEDTNVRIWTSKDKVIIKGEFSARARCEVYNVNGGEILNIRLADSELNTVLLPSGLKGVIIVRVTDGMKITTRKLVLL